MCVCVCVHGHSRIGGFIPTDSVDVRVCVRARALANWRGLFLRIVLMCVLCVCACTGTRELEGVYSYG